MPLDAVTFRVRFKIVIVHCTMHGTRKKQHNLSNQHDWNKRCIQIKSLKIPLLIADLWVKYSHTHKKLSNSKARLYKPPTCTPGFSRTCIKAARALIFMHTCMERSCKVGNTCSGSTRDQSSVCSPDGAH